MTASGFAGSSSSTPRGLAKQRGASAACCGLSNNLVFAEKATVADGPAFAGDCGAANGAGTERHAAVQSCTRLWEAVAHDVDHHVSDRDEPHGAYVAERISFTIGDLASDAARCGASEALKSSTIFAAPAYALAASSSRPSS